MAKPIVLVTAQLSPDIIAELEEHATVIQGGSREKGMPRAEVMELVGDVSAVLNQNELKIDAELLDRAPRLKIVANATAGFDNMNVSLMRERRVWGSNCPDSFSIDTANHAIVLLLTLSKRVLEADSYVRSGQWRRDGWMPGGRWDGMSVTDKRIGIVGYGNIGRRVAKRAAAFDMNVVHTTRRDTGEPGWLPLPDLLATSDIVSVHCPLNDATRHLINARTLALMKRDAILLNLARGAVVNIADLIASLKRGDLFGAGLDVFEFEPDVPPELVAMPNVVLTPHMAGCTVETRRSALRLCIENIARVLGGQEPRTPTFAM